MGYELCCRDVRNVVHPYTTPKYNRRKQVITLERYNSFKRGESGIQILASNPYKCIF